MNKEKIIKEVSEIIHDAVIRRYVCFKIKRKRGCRLNADRIKLLEEQMKKIVMTRMLENWLLVIERFIDHDKTSDLIKNEYKRINDKNKDKIALEIIQIMADFSSVIEKNKIRAIVEFIN